MSRPSFSKKAIDDAKAARDAKPVTVTYPLVTIVRQDVSIPERSGPLGGTWYHSTLVGEEIRKGGWQPHLIGNSMYGTAIYLSRTRWQEGSGWEQMECIVEISRDRIWPRAGENEVPPTETEYEQWLQDQRASTGRLRGTGTHANNQRILAYMMQQGYLAAWFLERGVEVLAIYDPSAIRILT